jgi:REP-associated tyrosine transposase
MQIHCMPSLPTLGYRHLRKGRHSLPGQLYLLTWTTSRRKPHFLDTESARAAARTISSAELWFPSRCLCWVLMPDHWHGLIELGEGANLSTVVQRIKGVTAHQVNPIHSSDKPLWAKGFHDHALRQDEAIEQTARYIIANPVRAGLVEDPMDYPYWDAYFIGENSG